MLVLRRIPNRVPTVGPARDDHREFANEVDASLGDRGLLSDLEPRRFGSLGVADPGLALAVITVTAGFQHVGRADVRERGPDLFERRNRAPGGNPGAATLDERFFARAVLGDRQR